MRIKEVRITGFRSYKDNTHVYGFSPRSNVVVGRNGSGKSNFFHAIQFVLSDEYSHLKEEQRLGLLHESTGPKVAHARVEITFDNTEKRIMAFDNPEVKIVRQIGKKKDQYYIDNKMVPRAEVVNLMESAGFSRSNPYYIVKQGKINELATSPDAYKLKLLREVAGTRVYDERKEESLKILKETKMKTEKIEGLLKYIDERLQTLETEKEDLKEYQKLDKTKRSIEYTMYDNTNKEAIKEKSKLDELKSELVQKDNEVKAKLSDVITEMEKLKIEKQQLNEQYLSLKEDKEALQLQETEYVEEKIKLKLEIDSLNDEATRERQGRQTAEAQLQNISDEIHKNETELEEIRPQYEKLVEEESRLNTDIRIDEAQIKELLAKQGQTSQFSSTEARDRFLTKEVKRFAGMISDNQDQVNMIEKELQDLESEEEKLNAEVHRVGRDIEENRFEMDNHGGSTSTLKQQYDDAYQELQAASRHEKEIREKISASHLKLNAASEKLKQVIPRGVQNGISGIRRILEIFESENRNGIHDDVLNGYHGLVIDLISVASMFRTAVEAVAGSKLYYHVVDTDAIGKKLVDRFNDMQMFGEINFYPLNRVVAPFERPFQQTNDARPMTEVVDHHCDYDKINKHMTANWIIVRALDDSADILRKQGYDVISIEGDQITRRGVITGGYFNNKKNKLNLNAVKQEMQKEMDELRAQLADAENVVIEKKRAAEMVRNRMNQNEMKISDFHRKHRELTEMKQQLSNQYFMVVKMKDPKKAQLLQIKNRIRELTAQKELIERDIGTSMNSQLTSSEEQTVKDLRKKVDQLKETLADVTRRRMALMNTKNTIDNLLNKKLYKTQQSLSARVDDISDNERRHRLEATNAQYSSLLTRMKHVQDELATANTALAEHNVKANAHQLNMDNIQEQQRDLENQQKDFQKQHEVIAHKEDEVKQKREDSLKKMRLLGALPTDTFSKWQNVKQKELEKKLMECVNSLKKYEHVNKKALDQYLTASTQKEELTKRMAEQKKSEDAIEELLKVLENRKYEAIDLTFKQVKRNFEQVFKQLVPHGRGKMQMCIRDPKPGEENVNSVELYDGISVLVSFVSDDGDAETREMTQLSGGQKSLVALAIIFAIQKCDPAPFYLFDEIDAALDAQHRKSVADMIQQLSDQAQFVTTTFRPELLGTAEKFFGVRFRNKVSHIDSVSREQAYDFVEDDTTHG